MSRATRKAPGTAIYSPGYRVKSGPIEALAAYAREIKRDRWQIWMNFFRKFKSSYSTTFFGMFWAFTLPLVPIGAYTLLASMRVVATTDDMSHLVYIALGVTLYAYVTAPIEQTMAALKGDMALLSKTHIGVFSVILGRFGSVVFETLVRLGLIGVLMFFFWWLPHSLGVTLVHSVSACGLSFIAGNWPVALYFQRDSSRRRKDCERRSSLRSVLFCGLLSHAG